jgi:hypothetical protein
MPTIVCLTCVRPHPRRYHAWLLDYLHAATMVLTRAQQKRKAFGEPIYIAPPARKARRGKNITRITDQPDELLLEIFNYIGSMRGYLRNYHSLCLVNRRFNAVCTSFLYDYIQLSEKATPSPSLLLRTISSTPRLRSFTTEFHCTQVATEIKDSDLTVLGAIMKDWPDRQYWSAILEQGKNEALLMVLLLFMPQLRTFTKEVRDFPVIDPANPPGYLLPFLLAAQQNGPGRRPSFDHLTTLSVIFNGKHASHISALFRLPALRCLVLESCHEDLSEQADALSNISHILATWECPERSSTVAELSILADLPYRVLDIMLRSCASLQRLWLPCVIDLDIEPKWIEGLADSLLQHQSTLQHISLNDCRWLFDGLLGLATGQLRILTTFPELRSYVGPLALLLRPSEVSAGSQLATLARLFDAQAIKYLCLEVSSTWKSDLLLELNDPEASKILPYLDGLYIHMMVDQHPTPSLEHILVLEDYFASTDMDFQYQLDYWYHPLVTESMQAPYCLDQTTDYLQTSRIGWKNSEQWDRTGTSWWRTLGTVCVISRIRGARSKDWIYSNGVMRHKLIWHYILCCVDIHFTMSASR